jgi:thiol-disulfide isomerase/thioredoxin
MAKLTRRSALAGAAAVVVSAAQEARASIPRNLSQHPGYRAWTAPGGPSALPLQEMVETAAGASRLAAWLGHRPAVLAFWASWCAPCLIEKPHQAILSRRLASAGASARIFALQAYDEGVGFADARWMLDRIGAEALPTARASPGAEDAFRRLFSPSRRDQSRATLPVVLLIGGDGLELGRAVGSMRGADNRTDYWQDEATFDFLSLLV